MEFLKSTETEEGKNEKQEKLDFILKKSKELDPEILENYSHFHKNPELGGEEFETAKRVEEYLNSLGIEILGKGIGGTGIVARIDGKKEKGSTIALRADMDALLIENKETKTTEKMHACGHDANTAGLMGAAKILKEMAGNGKLEGDVVLLFQPNEEKAKSRKTGAVQMVKFLEKEGLRDKIKAFLGLHLFSQIERGNVWLSDDIQMAGSGFVDIKLKSRGGHGMDIKTRPDLDLILSSIKKDLSENETLLNYYKNDEALVDSMGPKNEAKADNVMLSEGNRTFVLRITSHDYKNISKGINKTIKDEVAKIVKDNIEKAKSLATLKGAARSEEDMSVEIDIDVKPNYRPVIHRDQNLVNIASDSAAAVVKNFNRINKSSPASEDFSFYLEEFRGKEIPGIFLMLGAANSEKGLKGPHHSPDFKFDTEVIKDLSAVYSNFAVNAIESLNKKEK